MPSKPDGYPTVSPYLIVERAEEVIGFLAATLGATVERRFDLPDGSLMHAELRIDDSIVMIGASGGEWPPVPAHLHVYSDDVDAAFNRAIAAGGRSVQDPETQEYGDRRCGVMDPGGNTWWIATPVI
jgi:PhnB protein